MEHGSYYVQLNGIGKFMSSNRKLEWKIRLNTQFISIEHVHSKYSEYPMKKTIQNNNNNNNNESNYHVLGFDMLESETTKFSSFPFMLQYQTKPNENSEKMS